MFDRKVESFEDYLCCIDRRSRIQNLLDKYSDYELRDVSVVGGIFTMIFERFIEDAPPTIERTECPACNAMNSFTIVAESMGASAESLCGNCGYIDKR